MASYKQTKRAISLIILHCSSTREDQHFTVADIKRWHLQRGFVDCGYHLVVEQDGTISAGRPLTCIGAHCRGHNRNSIGICYVGGLDKDGHPADTRNEAQKKSLRELLTQLHQDYPKAIILGHRDLSPDLNGDGKITPNEYIKRCPCFDAMVEYADLQPAGLWEGKPIY